MKKSLILILLLLSFALSAQETLTKDIIVFNTIEKNKKTITFSKQTTSNNINYVLNAKNKTSKDFNKCQWASSLTQKELYYFAITLAKIKQGEEIKTNFCTLRSKNNRIYIRFNDTKCTSEHKTHYFQKSCNRELSFIVQQNQTEELTKALTKENEQDILVNQ